MKKDTYDYGRAEPFFPDFLFKEAVAALIAFVAILLLATFQHIPLEAVADPTDSSYIPRPEWYFLFLFELLKYFPGNLEALGAVVIPGLGVLALILLPFYDRSKVRRPTTRPLATAVAGVAMMGVVYLTSVAIITTPPAPVSASLTAVKLTAVESAGKKLYNESGCGSCHKAGGGPAPDLAKIGGERDAKFLEKYVRDPKSVNPAAVMPGFAAMGDEKLNQLVRYLQTMK